MASGPFRKCSTGAVRSGRAMPSPMTTAPSVAARPDTGRNSSGAAGAVGRLSLRISSSICLRPSSCCRRKPAISSPATISAKGPSTISTRQSVRRAAAAQSAMAPPNRTSAPSSPQARTMAPPASPSALDTLKLPSHIPNRKPTIRAERDSRMPGRALDRGRSDMTYCLAASAAFWSCSMASGSMPCCFICCIATCMPSSAMRGA